MYKRLTILFFLIFIITSCATDNKVKKIDEKKEKVISYELNINEFPTRELIVNDVNFIGYINLKKARTIKLFKLINKYLNKNYFIAEADSLYFTISDIYKSQEFLLFLDDFNFDFEDVNTEKEQIFNKILFKTIKTDNQEFGAINFKNSSLYGDTALIKDLFSIYENKIDAFSEERYNIFLNSEFSKNNSDFKLFFIPNNDYKKILLDFSEKQTVFKPLIIDLNYIFLEVELQEGDILNINLTISKKDSINEFFTFLNTKLKLLLTLNGTPYSTLNTSEVMSTFDILKNIKINKVTENSILITISINEKNLEKYFRILSNFINKD